MKALTFAIALTLTSSTIALAQTPTPDSPRSTETQQTDRTTVTTTTTNPNLNRAKNLARQAAERANGGLNQYTAEAAMHGPASVAPYIDNGDNTLTFTFQGGAPGSGNYTTESVVTVDTTNWTVRLDYNGPIRNP